MTTSRKSAAKLNKNVFVIKQKSKRLQRTDTGQGHNFQEQEAFLLNFVEELWREGNPVRSIELKANLCACYYCQEGHPSGFYENYIDSTKKSFTSGFANWLKKVLTQADWSFW